MLAGRAIDLSRLEFDLLDSLRQRSGDAVSRKALLSTVWETDYEGGSNVVEAVVRTLRRKLGDAAPMVETVRGIGYRFVEPGAV